VIADFEGYAYPAGWTTTGDFAGTAPHAGGDGRVGDRAVDTFFGNRVDGDENTGSIVSPDFTIDHPYLDSEIAGGNHPGETAVNLVVGGKVVRTATGDDAGTLNWRSRDVRASANRRA
jgi:hypothetical protein